MRWSGIAGTGRKGTRMGLNNSLLKINGTRHSGEGVPCFVIVIYAGWLLPAALTVNTGFVLT